MARMGAELQKMAALRSLLSLGVVAAALVWCPVTQAQGWLRRPEKPKEPDNKQLNAAWQFDLSSSAFQSQKAGVETSPSSASVAPWRGTAGDSNSLTGPPQRQSSVTTDRAQNPGRAANEAQHPPNVIAPLPRRMQSGNVHAAPGGVMDSAALNSNVRGSSEIDGRAADRVTRTAYAQDSPNARIPMGTLPPIPYSSGEQFNIGGENGVVPLGRMNANQWNIPMPPEVVSEAIESTPPNQLYWWEADLGGPILRTRPQMPMSLQEALQRALNEAPELKILQADWYIQMQELTRRDAAFDWTTFVSSVWNRDSTPVGSQLDGAAQRLRSRTESASAGLRRLDRSGGQFEVSQQIGGKQSNSQFINPNNQGSSRLALQYQRPLLRGAGVDYNTGSLRLAQLDKDIAFDRMQAGIQDHLLATARAYWALVLSRGDFLQKVTSWSRAKAIADEMASRIEIDVTPGTLDRARAEVSSRLAQSIQSEHEIVAAQEVLLELIYASRFTEFSHYEVLTTTAPPHQPTGIDVEAQADAAVQSRSEVQQAIREIRAASIEYDLAKSDVLPQLNLVLTGYSAGLQPNYNIGQSFVDQFSTGEPGAGIGLDFEVPYRNRAAKAAAEQRRIAVTRLQREFETVVGEVKQDVRQQAIRRNKFAATLPQQWESLILARRLLDYSQTRRDLLADGVRVGDLYLSDLLQIQSRLQSAEFQYLQTQVSFAMADNALMRSLSLLQNLADPASGVGNDSNIVYQNSQTMMPVAPAMVSPPVVSDPVWNNQ